MIFRALFLFCLNVVEQAGDGLAENGVKGLRRDFGKGLEDEEAAVHERVREDEAACMPVLVGEALI